MSNYRRANAKGGTYFFTVVTFRRQMILCNENVRAALRAGIRDAQATHPFTINGWVLLPDHTGSYSTFHRYVQQGVYSLDWAGAAGGEKDGNFGEP